MRDNVKYSKFFPGVTSKDEIKQFTHTVTSEDCTLAQCDGIAPDLVEAFVDADNFRSARAAALPIFDMLWNAGCVTHSVEIVDGKRQHSFTVKAEKIRED